MNWYFVYAMYDRPQDRFYIGYTNNLKRRISEHKNGSTHTTHRMPNAEIAYFEASLSKADAQKRERQLKSGFGRGYLRRRLESHLLSEDQLRIN